MPIGDIFQQTVVAVQNGEPVANVFYLEVIDDAGTTDPEKDAAMALYNQVVLQLRVMQVTELVYECILSRRIRPTTAPARVIPVTDAGVQIGQELAANVVISFRHYSGNGDRNKRGRYYISGILESWVIDGRLDQANDVLFQAFIARLVINIVDGGRTYRVKHYSKKLNTFYDIDSGLVNPVTTKLRGRTPGLCSIS